MKAFAIVGLIGSLTFAVSGAWADDTNSLPPTIGTAQAAQWIGKQAVVTGVVAQVSFRPSLVFLNFDKAYPRNLFTAIIRSRSTNEFENLPALQGKAVSVKGWVRNYNGKPEMELTGKAQLKVLGERK